MNAKLEAKLKTLPRSAGVYFHKSKAGEIIYVGKAAVLKNRVRQYFQSTRDMDVKTRALVDEIEDTDWVETESELDALFLESEMVKRYMPRYNILLRDDKSQLFVRIDMKSEWPTVTFTRNPLDDGADYFGPYYNGFAIKKALRYLRKIFPYYTKPPKSEGRPDLDAHIGLSPRPGTPSAEYKASLRQLIRYLNGGRKAILRDVEKEMRQAAKLHDFEMAAAYRNKLTDLRALQQRIMFGDREFLDISKDKALADLVELFGLPRTPARIEGYDISHMGGKNVVGSMVVFTNGVSDRAEYRKFKTAERNDDTQYARGDFSAF
ncbi:GIY-YIG nuclease family protein [Candidatus Saccharibacteria bacterium]|nr:GIY-YIG nuclease family protein [Candidatus Saccharibacteria bacterium]